MDKAKALGKFFLFARSAGLLTILMTAQVASAASTPNFYQCVDKVGGEYGFGRAPQACNASSFGDDRFVQDQFSPLIFSDTAVRTGERLRYSQEMSSLIREAAIYYIQKRKPAVSTTETNWWVTAVLVTASHESYWSHYRKASDSKLKLMRGDFGHGHGMMQIDDRAHFPAIQNGTAWNLIGNLIYAMDILYPSWVKAPTQSCVRSETNYEARIRATWSAYNGGGSKLCRWTNPQDPWAENDQNFLEALTTRPYQRYVANPGKISSFDVPCLMEKKENCPLRDGSKPPVLQAGILYQADDGRSCVINAGRAYCVDQVRDAICLNSVTGFTGKSAVFIEASALTPYAPLLVDRHRLCAAYDPTLFAVGSGLQTRQTLNFRSTPGGGVLGTVPAGRLLQVLDFELRNAPVNERYYKVRIGTVLGYVYGGETQNANNWAVASQGGAIGPLANAGETVKVVSSMGINLRATLGGTVLLNVPGKTPLKVQEVVAMGSENGVYYKVTYLGKTGYIYSGMLLPAITTAEWTQVLR
jgi:hypothetical protein